MSHSRQRLLQNPAVQQVSRSGIFRFEAREKLLVKRREFITFIGAAIAWPLTARAQQRFKIGVLDAGLGAAFTVPFMRKLGELGYVDGKNGVIEYKSAQGNTERLNEFAAEFARQQV